MTWRKFRSIKTEKKSVNQDAMEILSNYYRFSSSKEIRFDWGIPLGISLVLFLFIGFLSKNNTTVMSVLVDLNSAALNVMAILAGFNTASMAVIAATNQDTLKQLFRVKGINEENESGSEEKNILKQILTFFSYAIILQLLILVIGSIFVLVNKNAPQLYSVIGIINSLIARLVLSICGFVWFSIILHSLFVSIRNVSMIYRYILFLGRPKK